MAKRKSADGKTPGAKRVLLAENDRETRTAVSNALKRAGYHVTLARNGAHALASIEKSYFDLAFLDIWMPEMSGLDVIASARNGKRHPKIIVTTSAGAPEALLHAVREQAYEYLVKPFPAREAVEVANRALRKNETPPFEVISARPHWVEALAPCTRDAAERIQSFLIHLECELSEDMRRTVSLALRELLMNAVEWGGKLDPNRKVRIAYIRLSRMLLYRVVDPGAGFSFDGLKHAVAGHTAGEMAQVVTFRAEMGMRPGGFGIAMARAIADELLYSENQNEVILVKYMPHRDGDAPCSEDEANTDATE